MQGIKIQLDIVAEGNKQEKKELHKHFCFLTSTSETRDLIGHLQEVVIAFIFSFRIRV